MKKFLLGLICSFVISNVMAVPYFTIDGFNTTPMSVCSGPTCPAVSVSIDSQAATVFGGTRTIEVSGGAFPGIAEVITGSINIFSINGVAMTTLSYHSNTPMDLVQGFSNNYFSLDVLSIDQGAISYYISVNGILPYPPSHFPRELGAFDTTPFFAYSGVDFTQVTDISLTIISSNAAAGVVLDGISANNIRIPSLLASVPSGGFGISGTLAVISPTSLPLLGLGLVAFGFSRRKAK